MKEWKKAFTLIELLIVIAIIAILAAIVFVSLSSARKKAQNTRVQSDLSEISKAIEIARLDNTLPTGANAIPTGSWSNIDSAGYNLSSFLVDDTGAKLVSSNPKHPLVGKYYRIRAKGNNVIYLFGIFATSGGWCIKDGQAEQANSESACYAL